ncbi:retrovirus-related Pol polyprotein from transposon RE1 [Trichonephila clavipes]|nr:retrovirus-related Pol polyprotein from transposon RE1 [Trichonephila clavipes]
MRAKMGIMMGYAQRTKGYRIWLIDENKLVETINVRFDENKRGINFRQKVNSNLGYNLNLPDYYDDEDDFDRVKDSLTSRLVSKTSTETPSTSEKPDVSSDNHSLIPCPEVKWIRNIGRKVTGSNVYYSIEGEATRLKSFNEIERYCKRHNIKYDPSLFNFRKDNTESQEFSDLSEQQEALMVEVTIPNCYKQAIRSRDASKWHDAMDKEINVMMERKVWDLVDHPDNIKILENHQFFGTKYQPGEDVGIFISRVKTAATRLQEAGHKLDDLYIGFQLIRWLPQEFQSTVQQIYRWKEEDFRVVKIEAELILEANRLQLMKQDLEKAENAYLSSFTSKKSKTLPGATAAAHGDPNGKNDYQKKGDLKPITNMKMSLATEDKSCPVEGIGTLRFRVKYKGSFHEITLTDVLFNPKLRRNLLSGSRLESKGAHFVGTKGRKPSVLHLKPFGCLAYAGVPKQIRKKFDMRAKMGIMMGYAQRTKGYRIWLIDENKLVETINDDFDRVKDSLTSRLVSKTSTETPSTSEKPDVSSDNHSLIPCPEVKWIRNIGRKVTGSNVYYSIEGEATRLKYFNEIERYYLSEQQEALMVEVTIPNCYKQAIRSRDASKWHDAMDKEINVMMERKVWDLVDHPDSIKILENRWVYTIKYDEK